MKTRVNLIVAIAISFGFLFSGCKTVAGPIFSTNCEYVDFYEAGLKGKVFLTESNSVNFEYIPLGTVYISQTSGYVASDTIIKKRECGDPIYGTSKSAEQIVSGKQWIDASYETVLKKASQVALSMGGDAIININLKSEYLYYGNRRVSYPVITGMVVKRN